MSERMTSEEVCLAVERARAYLAGGKSTPYKDDTITMMARALVETSEGRWGTIPPRSFAAYAAVNKVIEIKRKDIEALSFYFGNVFRDDHDHEKRARASDVLAAIQGNLSAGFPIVRAPEEVDPMEAVEAERVGFGTGPDAIRRLRSWRNDPYPEAWPRKERRVWDPQRAPSFTPPSDGINPGTREVMRLAQDVQRRESAWLEMALSLLTTMGYGPVDLHRASDSTAIGDITRTTIVLDGKPVFEVRTTFEMPAIKITGRLLPDWPREPKETDDDPSR